MRYRIDFSIRAKLADHNGNLVRDEQVINKTDGLSCTTDTVLNYADLEYAEACVLRGGFPRLRVVDGKLRMHVEIDANRKLKRAEITMLREDFEGQLTDGIGVGCFARLAAKTGLSVEARYPLQSRCVQQEGRSWRPAATAERGNQRRMEAVKKRVDWMDSADGVVKGKPAVEGPASSTDAPSGKNNKSPGKPNLKKLLRLLPKVDRDQFFSQIQDEVEAVGDLSSIVDGEYPYGNFATPKLLRLLLKSGLPPETLDEKGHSLLVLAAVNPQSLGLLLKAGADVNRVCRPLDATALIRASRLDVKSSVALLLAHGADPNLKNSAGKTALDYVSPRATDPEGIKQMLGG